MQLADVLNPDMKLVCKVTFTADPTKPYSYFAGDFDPRPGDLVVVPVGKDNSLKIVTCLKTELEPLQTTFAVKHIAGLIVRQGEADRLK